MTGGSHSYRTSRPARAAQAAAVLAVAVCSALAGCMTQQPAGHASPATPPPLRATWMLTRPALTQLSADPAVRDGLGRSKIYQIVQPGQPPLAGVTTTTVVTFSSLADLIAALTANRLPAGTRAVLYDPEAWSFTPSAEQHDPVHAAARAAGLAHARGLQLIVAAALNLTTVLDPAGSGSRWQQFLSLGVVAGMAKVADIVELQAQSLERSPSSYAAFVREAAAQARSARPGVTVLAGLSTNPPGPVVSGQQLTAAIQASRGNVDGYWLNIPDPGPRCPTCNPARPDVGIAALRAVL